MRNSAIPQATRGKPGAFVRWCARLLALFVVSSATAGPVRLYEYNHLGELRTNNLIATAVRPNGILADGRPIKIGAPFTITNNASGVLTNNFQIGWYEITNRAVPYSAYVINVFDSGATVYDKTNVLESGYNTYVKTVYGTNPPPTLNEITNAVGNLYATAAQLTTTSNALQAAIDDIETSGDINPNAITNNDTRNVIFQNNLSVQDRLGLNTAGYSYLEETGADGFRKLEIVEQQSGGIKLDAVKVEFTGIIHGDATGASNVVARFVSGTLTNNTTGSAASATTATSATVATTATNLNPVAQLMSGRRIGPGRSLGTYAETGNNSQFALLSAGGTQGILRELWVMADVAGLGGLRTNAAQVDLLIYADSNLTCRINLANALGTRYRYLSNGHWSVIRSSRYLDTVSQSTNVPATIEETTLHLKFPMPFTNGMFARLTNYVAGTNWGLGYINSFIEHGTIPSELANWRTYATYATQEPTTGATSNHLFSASGEGYLLGTTHSMYDSQASVFVGYTDSHGLVFTTGSGAYWKPSGLDDYYKNTHAFAMGTMIADDHGTLNYSIVPYDYSGTAAVEAYRWFYDTTFSWTNGVSVWDDSVVELDGLSASFFYMKKL